MWSDRDYCVGRSRGPLNVSTSRGRSPWSSEGYASILRRPLGYYFEKVTV
jgi:hypothetical protein